MTPRRRSMVVAGALVATLMAAAFAPEEPEVAVPLRRAAADNVQRTAHGVAGSIGHAPVEPRATREPPTEVRTRIADEPPAQWLGAFAPPSVAFGPQSSSGGVPPETVAKGSIPAPTLVGPEPMMPPPVRFTVAGRYVDGDDVRLFVVADGQNLMVRVGDRIGADYMVEAIADAELRVRYLPWKTTQMISLEGVK